MLLCYRLLVAAALLVSGEAAPKIIFFVLADDVGYASVGFARGSPASTAGLNGGSLTPHLDALATDGLILDTMITAFWCTPSRSSFLTGRLPVHVQMGQDFPETPTAGIPKRIGSIASKLSSAGYRAHVTGKWDLGMATKTHLPAGRGFSSSLVYFEHMNEGFTQQIFPGGTACTLYGDGHIADLWSNDGPAVGLNGTDFVEYLFRDRLLEIIANASGEEPLFIYYAPHVVHYPLQVPKEWFDKFSFMTDDESSCNATVPYIYPGAGDTPYACRQQGAALMALLDSIVGNVTDAIKSRGWWNDTLMVFQSDNGAPLDVAEAGGSSAPLRGGKYSSWMGGIQVPAFVSGGYLPAARRGQREEGLIHIADWWQTLIGLAGGDPSDAPAVAAGLPPPDSLDMWPLIAGAEAKSRRVEIPVAPSTIISWPWKLLKGPQWWSGDSGSVYPNSSSPEKSLNIWTLCGDGCLYNVSEDFTESNNLAAAFPEVVKTLSARIDELALGFFSNNDTGIDLCPNGTLLCGCWAAVNLHGSFLGPYQE
jgi:arylsulfatase B